MPTLVDLPIELKGQIISLIESPKDIASLSQTCRQVYNDVLEDGYRVFVHNSFPTIRTPPYWKEAAHALTTASKCWDKRALVSRYIEERPWSDVVRLPAGRTNVKPAPQHKNGGRIPGSQSMGCQPVLDCLQEWTGSSWSSQREVLAMGMGAELKLRFREFGADITREFYKTSRAQRDGKYNHLGHREKWISWLAPGYSDGVDDITSLNILRHPGDIVEPGNYSLVVGRASGVLERLTISQDSNNVKVQNFETGNRQVRSAHVSSSEKPLLAACLGDETLSIFDATFSHDCGQPRIETSVSDHTKGSRTWTSRWLTPSRLAIGTGPSTVPITIYEVTDSGLSIEPLSKITSRGTEMSTSDIETPLRSTSVYSIVPISSSSSAGSAENGQFLSGWYTGDIKLHDMRTKFTSAISFRDPIDPTAPIYSLLPFGGERFVAGGARHSVIKVFDMRMPGARRYCHKELDTTQAGTVASPHELYLATRRPGRRPDFNLFLPRAYEGGWRSSRSHNRGRGGKHIPARRPESSVYALAAATSFSPVFYAGLEDDVLEIQLVSGTDRTPDTMFTTKSDLTPVHKGSEPYRWLDADNRVVPLSATEHSTGNSYFPITLWKQAPLSRTNPPDDVGWLPRWDYRWQSV